MSTVVGVRVDVVDESGAAQSMFLCRECWRERPLDFDEYGAFDLDAPLAGGACCEVCSWPLVDRLDVCVSCGDALEVAARGICPTCRAWAQRGGRLGPLRERALAAAVSLSAMEGEGR